MMIELDCTNGYRDYRTLITTKYSPYNILARFGAYD